jgi:Holliday junction resolvasome RuvABC endonuclease subunit
MTVTSIPMRQKSFTALVFDPGLANTAWTVIELRPGEKRITVVRYGLIQLTKEAKRVIHRADVDKYGIRVVTLGMLEDSLQELFQEHKPDFIVTEDVFWHPGRPTAYTALLQWITILERFGFKNGMCVYKVPTRSAKQVITGNGGADKDNIQAAVLANTDIKFKQRSTLDELSEHEADSIAVGWYFAEIIFPEAVQEQLNAEAVDETQKARKASK